MILLCFSLFDSKASIYTTPFMMAHRGQAVRAMMDLVQDPNTVPGKHPADFSLMLLGSFDDQSGIFTSLQPEHLGVLTTFLPSQQPVFKEMN